MARCTPEGSRQFIRFLFCGGTAAVANIAARYVLNFWMGYCLAIVLAYLIGMFTAFILFKIFVFQGRYTRPRLSEGVWFVLINTLALGQTLAFSAILAEYLFPWLAFTIYPATIAHILGVGVPIMTSYWGHKYLTFGKNKHVTCKLG